MMPVPKGKQKEYGKIVGHLINMGESLENAKDKADHVIDKRPAKTKSKKVPKKVAGFMGVILALWLGNAHAVNCTLSWDYPTTEQVDNFRLYKSATKGNYNGVIPVTVPLPNPRTATITYQTQCNVGEHYVVTAFKDGMLESDQSNELDILQLLKPSNLKARYTITIP